MRDGWYIKCHTGMDGENCDCMIVSMDSNPLTSSATALWPHSKKTLRFLLIVTEWEGGVHLTVKRFVTLCLCNALDYCDKHHSGLLQILTDDHQRSVEEWLKTLEYKGNFWVGLRQSRVFGFWIWKDSLVDSSHWENGMHPEMPLSHQCGVIQAPGYKWRDHNCLDYLPFICEERIPRVRPYVITLQTLNTLSTRETKTDMAEGSERMGFHRWKYAHYFKYIAQKDKNVVVQCKLCLGNKRLSTSANSSSNLLKHLQGAGAAATAPSDSEEEGGEEDMEQEGEDVVFTDIHDILSNGISEEQYSLPPHLRCASHTLNLISTNDVNKWLLANPESKAVYRSATAKCSALWTKCSRSTVASELAENICKRKLIVPVITRWNSFHDALACILTLPVPQLNNLCAELDIRVLSEREHTFLSEYCSVMKPLTVALDLLQGEDNCYYGCLLPTLEVLMSKISALKPGLSKMTAGLPDVLVKAIKTRFGPVLDSKEAKLAAVTLPKFKLRWLKEEQRKDAVKTMLIAECRSSWDRHEALPSQPQASTSSKKTELSEDLHPKVKEGNTTKGVIE
ncbi:hypothetical protein WMY93_013813 [Mugilogobius chulae]|uniref:C-type lectin domain-containing protein n=1 Tax=Mugilogobius chulae TaxID=88201 RepID=A0AAW0P548_9GOBI